MAVTIPGTTAAPATNAPVAAAAPTPPAVKPAQPPVLLELRFYKRYRREGVLYEKGTVYSFTPRQALILLSEKDHGKSVWKRTTLSGTRPVVKMQSAQKKIVDATKDKVGDNLDIDGDVIPTGEALDVGNDEEIADLLAEVNADDSEDEPGDTETL